MTSKCQEFSYIHFMVINEIRVYSLVINYHNFSYL